MIVCIEKKEEIQSSRNDKRKTTEKVRTLADLASTRIGAWLLHLLMLRVVIVSPRSLIDLADVFKRCIFGCLHLRVDAREQINSLEDIVYEAMDHIS